MQELFGRWRRKIGMAALGVVAVWVPGMPSLGGVNVIPCDVTATVFKLSFRFPVL